MHISLSSCLLTGATSPLGIALAKRLSAQGISLFLTGRDVSVLTSLANFFPSKFDMIAGDLTQSAFLKKLCMHIEQTSPDLIINNAGAGLYGTAIDFSNDENAALLRLNAEAALEISLSGARALKKQHKKGIILNISSAACFYPFPTFNIYAASKAFLRDFSLALDREMSSYGIRILCACPGQINTHFRKRASKGHFQKKTWAAMSPEKAADALMRQIHKKKPLYIFDFRYRLLTRFLKLMPRFLRDRLLMKSIKNRYTSNPL